MVSFLQPLPSGEESKNTMTNGIVTETCPAPECNLTDQEVSCFMVEMCAYVEMFEPTFQRPEQLGWSKNNNPLTAMHKSCASSGIIGI